MEKEAKSTESGLPERMIPRAIGFAVFNHYFIEFASGHQSPRPEESGAPEWVMQTVANHNDLTLEDVQQRYGEDIELLMDEMHGFFADLTINKQKNGQND